MNVVKPQIRTIGPNERLNEGIWSSTRHMLREVIHHRDHIRATFTQDFRSLYNGAFFGVFWNILLPLVPIGLYTALAAKRVFPSFDDVNPAAYVALGATVWFLLAGCIQKPLQTVQARNAEAMKTSLPLSAMVVSGFGQLLFDTGIRFLLVMLIVLLTSTRVEWTVVFVPIVLLPAMLLALGVGLIVGIANVIYADVGRVTTIALQYGIFLSGVIFPIAALPLSSVLTWNPAYVLIEHVRILSFRGIPETGWPLMLYAVSGFLVFLIGCRMFYLMEHRVRGIA